MCNRPLDKPAAMLGRLAIGPKCARRAELLLPAKKQPAVERDRRTVDWIEEVTA
jgi:hypothetical protein